MYIPSNAADGRDHAGQVVAGQGIDAHTGRETRGHPHHVTLDQVGRLHQPAGKIGHDGPRRAGRDYLAHGHGHVGHCPGKGRGQRPVVEGRPGRVHRRRCPPRPALGLGHGRLGRRHPALRLGQRRCRAALACLGHSHRVGRPSRAQQIKVGLGRVALGGGGGHAPGGGIALGGGGPILQFGQPHPRRLDRGQSGVIGALSLGQVIGVGILGGAQFVEPQPGGHGRRFGGAQIGLGGAHPRRPHALQHPRLGRRRRRQTGLGQCQAALAQGDLLRARRGRRQRQIGCGGAQAQLGAAFAQAGGLHPGLGGVPVGLGQGQLGLGRAQGGLLVGRVQPQDGLPGLNRRARRGHDLGHNARPGQGHSRMAQGDDSPLGGHAAGINGDSQAIDGRGRCGGRLLAGGEEAIVDKDAAGQQQGDDQQPNECAFEGHGTP